MSHNTLCKMFTQVRDKETDPLFSMVPASSHVLDPVPVPCCVNKALVNNHTCGIGI